MRKILLLFLVVLANAAPAQSLPNPLRVGAGFFGMAYSGDLSGGEGNFRVYPGGNLSLQFLTQKLISPQLNVGFGRFIAQDRDVPMMDSIQPNTFVETSFFYVDFRLKARFLRQGRVIPHLSAGLGMLGYSPRDAEGNALIDNIDTRAEGETFGNITASFPLSAGAEFRLSDIISLYTEYTFRPTTSDYLDNIGQLGQKKGKDKMHFFQIGIFITLNP